MDVRAAPELPPADMAATAPAGTTPPLGGAAAPPTVGAATAAAACKPDPPEPGNAPGMVAPTEATGRNLTVLELAAAPTVSTSVTASKPARIDRNCRV